MLRSLAVVLALVCLPLAPVSAARPDAVDAYLLAEMRRRHVPGLSVAVVRNGRVVKAKGYGLANIETGTPAGPETVYKIASLSKQFVAAALFALVEDGRVGLDDELTKYLDDAPQSWRAITIRQLLSHTAGLNRDTPGYTPFEEQRPLAVLRASYGLPLAAAPGTAWDYSNLGYYVLAAVVERASGVAWERFVAERVFARAGLAATRTTTNVEIVPNRAWGYTWNNGRLEIAANLLSLRPSGAFLSTVLDLAKWDAALDRAHVLGAASRDAMWTPAHLADGTPTGYGFGWFVDTFRGHRRVRHDGGLPGFAAEYARYPDDRLTVVVLANADTINPARTAERVAGFYVPSLAPPRPILDRNPKATALVRAFLERRTLPEPDERLFMPDFLARVKPGWANRLGYFKELGRLRSLELIERGEAGAPWFTYRATYDGAILIVRVSILGDRIAGGEFSEE